jgi:hypothetical protein
MGPLLSNCRLRSEQVARSPIAPISHRGLDHVAFPHVECCVGTTNRHAPAAGSRLYSTGRLSERRVSPQGCREVELAATKPMAQTESITRENAMA